MFKVPFSIFPPKALKKISRIFLGLAEKLSNFFPFLKLHLKQAEAGLNVKEYLSMCITSVVFMFIFLSAIIGMFALRFWNAFLIGPTIALVICFFMFFQQLAYPKLIATRRVRDLEKNLLPALQNFLIQLNSGVPLFNILVNIASSNYGAVSTEFKKAVRQMTAGRPQIDALEELSSKNPSIYFRRTIWQIVNGMKAGSDMGRVIKEIINSLGEEQLLQIQKYGSQLNPLAMFYMLIAVIVPSLGITFVIIISSFLAMPETITKSIFWGLFGAVLFFQIIFLGVIKSRRPTLLG